MDTLHQRLKKAMDDLLFPKTQLQYNSPDILQLLCLPEPNYESLKKLLASSKFKRNVETLEASELQCLAYGLDEFEANFDLSHLMICAMFGYTDKGSQLISEGATVDIQNKQGLTALMFASMFQFEDFVEMLIDKGAKVNLKDRRKMDALMWAILQENDDIAEILLNHKADVHARTTGGLNALHIAIAKGCYNIVEMLLEKNVNVDSKSLDGWTPLMRSVCLQDSALTKLLLKQKVNVDEPNLQSHTALHISVMHQNAKSVSYLLKHGAKVTCKDNLGMTPLMYAAFGNNRAIVHNLLENGAKDTLNCENNCKQTALHWAILGTSEDTFHLLINAGSNTNTYDICGFSTFLYACSVKKTDIVNELLKRKMDNWYKEEEFLQGLQVAVAQNDIETTRCLLNFRKHTKILTLIRTEVGKNIATQIITAASNKNKDIVRLLLDSGADVNSVSFLMQSVLAISVWRGDLPTVKLLVVKYKAEVDLKDNRGDTPLILAAATNNKPIVDFILKQKPNRLLTNNFGVSALMESATFGCFDIVKSLYVKDYDLELSDSQGWTPLMFASYSGDVNTVRFILDKGAKTNVCSNMCATPLIIASSRGYDAVVSLLLERGACINDQDIKGQTALIHASLNRNVTVLEILLKNRAGVGQGVGVNMKTDDEKGLSAEVIDVGIQDCFGRTALMYAVQNGDSVSTKLLCDSKANCCQGDINGTTPLMTSAFNGSTECLKILLTHSLDVNNTNADGNTALHFASSNGHSDIVSLLLEKKAHVNKANKNGDTPLMLASAKGYDSIVQSFLKYASLEIDYRNSIDGRSALMVAAQYNRLSTVQLLAEGRANVNATIESGENALHLTVICGSINVAIFLIASKKIDVNALTKDGASPISLCVRHQRLEILKHLVEYGAEVKNMINYSIRLNSLAALKIILQTFKLQEKDKRKSILLARDLKFFEIVDFLEHYDSTNMKDEGRTQASYSKDNAAHSIPVDTLMAAKSSSSTSISEPEADRIDRDIPMESKKETEMCSTSVSDQTLHLSIDDFENKVPFYFQNCKVIFNDNIFNGRVNNSQFGEQNTLNNMSTENVDQG